MSMQYLERRKGRIEIIPMIDIMLFLLVFFVMITIRMIPAHGITTQLPSSSTTQQLHKTTVTVIVQADGQVEVNGRAVSLDALTQQLREASPDHTRVTVVAQKTVSVQTLLNVMDACRKAGVSDVGLAAHPRK